MTPEQLAVLRAPFDSTDIGRLPKITCPACSKAQTRNCNDHRKSTCKTCGNWITEKHVHLDYVGHAATTNRLLAADPDWTWEPVAYNTDGLPALDRDGGMWIRLTVCGVTRLGYGHADGKTGGNAIKEAIGDAIRNAAMRFGVAIDLWHKGTLSGAVEPTSDAHDNEPAAQPLRAVRDAENVPQAEEPPAKTVIRRQPAADSPSRTKHDFSKPAELTLPLDNPDAATSKQVAKLSILFNRAHWDDDAIDAYISKLSGGRTTSRKELTKAEIHIALEEMEATAS